MAAIPLILRGVLQLPSAQRSMCTESPSFPSLACSQTESEEPGINGVCLHRVQGTERLEAPALSCAPGVTSRRPTETELRCGLGRVSF